MRNYADFLVEDLEGRLDEEQKSYLSGIKKATAEGQQMILDLLAFSRTGEPLGEPEKIEIWCRRNLEHQIEVLVKDNGIGIEQRYFDQIFHVFQRLHPAASYEGTGIGLSIVKKAAAALGGSVRFESSPGKGSTFILTLPEIVHQSIGS